MENVKRRTFEIIRRGHETIVPRGDTVLIAGDKLVIGAEGYKDEIGIKLRELVLRERHPWVGIPPSDPDRYGTKRRKADYSQWFPCYAGGILS